MIARAIDPATTSAIWARLRSGQRGVMVRSIYSPDGRAAFDEVSRRFKTDPELQSTITRYLNDFERMQKEADMKDPLAAPASRISSPTRAAFTSPSPTPAAACMYNALAMPGCSVPRLDVSATIEVLHSSLPTHS